MKHGDKKGISRREFVKGTGGCLIATTAGLTIPGHLFAEDQRRYNILLIVTDQERYMPASELPAGYRLPGHEKLAARGTVFENHQIASCVCTPSRSVIYTGQHIQNNGMFDNTNFPWSNDLSTDIPTVGDMLRRQGYYTAYKGKWHLTDEFETDPREMNNLALDRQKNGEVLIAMNEKLNRLIESEVGEDIGQTLPGGADANWTLDPSISHLRM